MFVLIGFQVRLVVGPASRASLREAGASGAKMVVVRAGKNFPEQEASDADAESIGQLVEVCGEKRNGFSVLFVCITCRPKTFRKSLRVVKEPTEV